MNPSNLFDALVTAAIGAIEATAETLTEAFECAMLPDAPIDFNEGLFDAPAMSGSQLVRDIARGDRAAARRMGWAA